jgi:hypothetical protein
MSNPGYRAGIGLTVAALLTLSCSQAKPDPRTAILENQVKMLMTVEAQQGFTDLFKTTFKPDQAQMLLGADLQRWFQESHTSLNAVPEPIRESIRDNRGAALLIRGGLPGKDGHPKDVVYLRPPRFGIRRFLLVAQPDPCGDGNPATCEFCSGCSGEVDGGTIHTCVCTQSCDDCRPCPSC